MLLGTSLPQDVMETESVNGFMRLLDEFMEKITLGDF